MARLTIALNAETNVARADLSLEITYARFQHGWVYYNIYPAFDGRPLLNGGTLKASHHHNPACRPGSVSACEDEFCSLIPAMRRFIETGNPEEWTPTDPDVTLKLARDQDDTAFVNLLLEIDQYQWRSVRAYGGSMISVGFTCAAGAFHQFYRELRAEFVAFRDANDITGFNKARDFHRPQHEWF